MAIIDASYVLTRAAIRAAQSDTLGTAVYSQTGQPSVVVTAQNPVVVDGVQLHDWWADRCRVDLFGLASVAGATLRLKLLVGSSVQADEWVTVLNGAVLVQPGTINGSLTLGIASGWLGKFWVLLGEVGGGEVCGFAARYTLDRAGAGLYSALGNGVAP